ncbi:MAG: adenylate/guanylate cyclase domain-containing protein [Bacteroidota bacterium]
MKEKIIQSAHVNEENKRFYVITHWAYIIGFFGHILAYFNFNMLGIDEMAFINLVYSIPSFAIAFFINRSGRHNLAFFIAFLELLAHQVLSTYYLGWAFGAHFWLIYLAGLSFFNHAWKTWFQLCLLALVLVSYVYIFNNFQTGTYELEQEVLISSSLGSALVTITIISLLINYYSKAAMRAEKTLKKEKEKTTIMLKKVEALFGQQVSQEIAEELISSDFNLDSKQYDVSIMFLDIRDFTLFADSHEPSEVALFQNTVFSNLIEIVKKHQGIVLQILGDGIMAVFGAPKILENHAQCAVNAGYEMIHKVTELGEQGVIPVIKVGIGINSGKVIAGNVGNQSRRFYSLTGKHVIIAARVEQLNKKHQSQFLVSANTYNALSKKPEFEKDLGKVPLKGIEEEVGVFKLA